MARCRLRADGEPVASGGRRIWVALACIAALVAVAAPAALPASSTSMAGLESGLLQQLNAVRADHGLPALRANAKLAAAADQHSREMADDGYFDHNSVDGTSFSSRIAKWYPLGGFHSWLVGENLLWSSPTVDPSGAVAMWMRSAPHRANILNRNFRDIGIGAVYSTSARGAYTHVPVTIVTTDFGVRR
jgi:uncharacterized protein YkwD